jgi:hypothetical protein
VDEKGEIRRRIYLLDPKNILLFNDDNLSLKFT